MGFFSSNEKEKIFLLLDISSGSVGASLFLSNKKEVPFILKTFRKNFSFSSNDSLIDSEKSIIRNVDLICEEIQKSLFIKPDKIFCVLSTPWSHGEVYSIKYESDREFVVNQTLLNKLINDEVDKIKNNWPALTKLIDRKIVKVTLNGYNTDNPIHKKAKKIKLDVFLSLTNSNFLHTLEEKINKTFKTRILVTSQMFSNFISVRDIFDIQNNFIIIDFGEEVTEVMVMKEDHLTGTAFFPFGKNHIIKNIAKRLNKSNHETKSLLNLFHDGFIDENINHGFIKTVHDIGRAWLSEFKIILNQLVPDRYLPHNIFIVSDSQTEHLLSGYFGKVFFPEFTTSHNDFNVIIADSKTMHDFVDFAEKVERDPKLIMKSIFINNL